MNTPHISEGKIKYIGPDGKERDTINPEVSIVKEFKEGDSMGFIEELRPRRLQTGLIQTGTQKKLKALFGAMPDYNPRVVSVTPFSRTESIDIPISLFHINTRPSQGITRNFLDTMVKTGTGVIIYMQMVEPEELDTIKEHYRVTILAKKITESHYILITKH